ncbi:PDC sensor domain-containing protein, partial [Type-D symbiont of Plautia stali]|uniref:PDC sensor domain-containing protein n=1 Tax=Type-D symbiont of Plautia stali TaxID=1560356 RepID=UPI0019100B88
MLPGKLRLRTLLILLSVGGVILTACLLLGSLLIFQKGNIEDSLLESNIAYARKLADTTDRYLGTAQRELAWSAGQIKGLNDSGHLRDETDRLRLQSGFFNTVVVVNRDAVIAATSPESLSLIGIKLHSDASRQAITTQKPFISSPFTSATGNYVIFLSQPLFTPDGTYLGYIGGTIYLKKQSMLSDILSL